MLDLPMVVLLKSKLTSYFSLFASMGTLFCCALPSLFVALGMGATLAGLISSFPQIIWISKYKNTVFLLSGALLLFACFMQYKSRFEPCPTDPALARACNSARAWSFWILVISIVIWLVGAFFAFIAPYYL